MELTKEIEKTLIKLKELTGLTNEEIALQLGYNKTYISDVLKRGGTQKFLNVLQNLYKSYVSEKTNLPMVNEPEVTYLAQRRKKKNNTENTNDRLPAYDVGSRLGTVPTYSDNSEAMIGTLPRNLFPGCNHAEIVRGDSMYPLVRNGAVVVCKEFDKSLIINGDIYLIHTTNGLNTCKYIHKIKGDPSKVKIISYNKEVPEDEIRIDEIIRIFRVLFIINPA